MLERALLKLARKWIAGENRQDAIEHARELNLQGMNATISYVGEHYRHLSLVHEAEKEYELLCSEIRRNKLRAGISVKLSELGLEFSNKLCRKELERVLEQAHKHKVFAWIDMEQHKFTDKSIDAYLHFLPSYEKTGLTLQSSLKRSYRDLSHLLRLKEAKIRLVKGAYNESQHLSLKGRGEVEENYRNLMILLFHNAKTFAIATHDLKLINDAKELKELSRRQKNEFEFQMLMGFKQRLKKKLVRQGYNVTEYVPYGRNWKGYVKRRLLERKANILHAAKSILE